VKGHETLPQAAKNETHPEVIPGDQASGLLLICDHASNRVPPELSDLGLDLQVLNQHVAIDVGAAPLTRRLARDLGAPAVLSTTSRLVIDFNRTPGGENSIPEISHEVAVPGNTGITPSEAGRRRGVYFQPYHDQVAETLTWLETAAPTASIISIHSFTPYLDEERPWHVGVLWDQDQRLAEPILAALYDVDGLVVGANQPYSGHLPLGYTCQTHGDTKGRPNVIFEVRQDLIDTPTGVDAMADILVPVIANVTRSIQQQG
jgi:predicted N-formylglutamate amidohydrolase